MSAGAWVAGAMLVLLCALVALLLPSPDPGDFEGRRSSMDL